MTNDDVQRLIADVTAAQTNGDSWTLLHRHADPLIERRDLAATRALQPATLTADRGTRRPPLSADHTLR